MVPIDILFCFDVGVRTNPCSRIADHPAVSCTWGFRGRRRRRRWGSPSSWASSANLSPPCPPWSNTTRSTDCRSGAPSTCAYSGRYASSFCDHTVVKLRWDWKYIEYVKVRRDILRVDYVYLRITISVTMSNPWMQNSRASDGWNNVKLDFSLSLEDPLKKRSISNYWQCLGQAK